MKRAVSAMALAAMLASASLAIAAESWVLWIKHQPRGSDGSWDLWGRYRTRSACQEARRQVIYDGLLRNMLKREDFKTEEQLQHEADKIAAKDTRHQCLPDSADPRP